MIRSLALALIIDGDRLLVSEGFDEVKNERFYRLLGGGIDFGETGEDAVARELREEIGVHVTKAEYLDTLENIYVYRGERGHELARVYRVTLADRDLSDREAIKSLDSDWIALWRPAELFLSGRERLYPDGVVELLER